MYLNKKHNTRTLYTFMKKILFCLTKIKEKNIANIAYIMNILHRHKKIKIFSLSKFKYPEKTLRNMIRCYESDLI